MMNELTQKWLPLNISDGAYDVGGISWNEIGITFTIVSDERHKEPALFHLTWNHGCLIAYHVTDETYRADCWKKDLNAGGRFYVSSNSAYIEMMREKSPLFPDRVLHFLLIGTNTIVDILAKDYPTVEPVG